MKKIVLSFSIALLAITTTSAQTKTASKLGEKSKFSKADSTMCSKEWHLVSHEELGTVTKPPGEKNKNDLLIMNLDMRFAMILAGEKKTGTWARTGQNIHFTDEHTGKKFSVKVMIVEANKFKVDYFNEGEGRSIFEYSIQ